MKTAPCELRHALDLYRSVQSKVRDGTIGHRCLAIPRWYIRECVEQCRFERASLTR